MLNPYTKLLILMVLAIIAIAVVFALAYHRYCYNIVKRCESLIGSIAEKIQSGDPLPDTESVYLICQKYLNVPGQYIDPPLRIEGFSKQELALIIYLALNLGPTASLQFGWRAQRNGPVIEREGTPLIWVSFQDEHRHDLVVTVSGGDAWVQLLTSFIYSREGDIIIESRLSPDEMEKGRQELASHSS